MVVLRAMFAFGKVSKSVVNVMLSTDVDHMVRVVFYYISDNEGECQDFLQIFPEYFDKNFLQMLLKMMIIFISKKIVLKIII